MERQDEVVLLEKYENPIDANIVKGMLESNGIIAGVMEDNLSRGLLMTPTCVMVMRRDLERAQELLKTPPPEAEG